MKKKYQYEVVENNGGGLTLYVWLDGILIYAHAGYQCDDGHTQLRNDIAELGTDNSPVNWDGNDLFDEDIINSVRRVPVDDSSSDYYINDDMSSLTEEEYYDDAGSSRIIADNDGIYPELMGNAGSLAFGL